MAQEASRKMGADWGQRLAKRLGELPISPALRLVVVFDKQERPAGAPVVVGVASLEQPEGSRTMYVFAETQQALRVLNDASRVAGVDAMRLVERMLPLGRRAVLLQGGVLCKVKRFARKPMAECVVIDDLIEAARQVLCPEPGPSRSEQTARAAGSPQRGQSVRSRLLAEIAELQKVGIRPTVEILKTRLGCSREAVYKALRADPTARAAYDAAQTPVGPERDPERRHNAARSARIRAERSRTDRLQDDDEPG